MSDKISRRGFMKRCAGFAVLTSGLFGLFKYLSPKTEKSGIIITEDMGKIPEGGALIFSDRQLALLKLDGKITAVSLTCTHLGCTISLDGDRFACPCHGSVFALNGDVIKGPAVKRLKTYKTEISGKRVTVFSGETA